MKSKLSAFMPSFADELAKIQAGQPSLAHLIFGLGALMLAMHLGSNSAVNRNKEKKSSVNDDLIPKAAKTNSMSKTSPSKTQYGSKFDEYQARYIGPVIG